MARMVRKQVYIDPAHEEKLKKLSAAFNMSEAEVIRRAIEGLRLDDQTLGGEDFGHSLADIYQDYPRRTDPQAWLEELAFIEERAHLLPEGGSTTTWRRH